MCLGWGSGYADEDIEDILWYVSTARPIEHDRWCVNIRNYGYFGIKKPTKVFIAVSVSWEHFPFYTDVYMLHIIQPLQC